MLLEMVLDGVAGRPACAPHRIMLDLSGTKHYRAIDSSDILVESASVIVVQLEYTVEI